MNNKGQTLVLFVALLPFIFILLVFVFDLAFISSEKSKLDQIAKSSVRNVMVDHIDSDKVKNNIIANDKDIKIIHIDANSICISKEQKPIFGQIIGYDKFNIKSCYEGKFESNKLILEKKGK